MKCKELNLIEIKFYRIKIAKEQNSWVCPGPKRNFWIEFQSLLFVLGSNIWYGSTLLFADTSLCINFISSTGTSDGLFESLIYWQVLEFCSNDELEREKSHVSQTWTSFRFVSYLCFWLACDAEIRHSLQ